MLKSTRASPATLWELSTKPSPCKERSEGAPAVPFTLFCHKSIQSTHHPGLWGSSQNMTDLQNLGANYWWAVRWCQPFNIVHHIFTCVNQRTRQEAVGTKKWHQFELSIEQKNESPKHNHDSLCSKRNSCGCDMSLQSYSALRLQYAYGLYGGII